MPSPLINFGHAIWPLINTEGYCGSGVHAAGSAASGSTSPAMLQRPAACVKPSADDDCKDVLKLLPLILVLPFDYAGRPGGKSMSPVPRRAWRHKCDRLSSRMSYRLHRVWHQVLSAFAFLDHRRPPGMFVLAAVPRRIPSSYGRSVFPGVNSGDRRPPQCHLTQRWAVPSLNVFVYWVLPRLARGHHLVILNLRTPAGTDIVDTA